MGLYDGISSGKLLYEMFSEVNGVECAPWLKISDCGVSGNGDTQH